jgi:ferric-dicitrate binding protein FerR (iron transport regulator)
VFEIGNSLRSARERQGLGYPEVELATKIRAKYIRALEEEDFTAIPGDAYMRGFLRTYADYLGLDGEVYVEEYASRNISSWRDELPPRPARRRVPRRERPFERRAVLLVLAGIVTVTVLVFVAWRYGGSSSNVPGGGSRTQTQKHHRAVVPDQLVLRGTAGGTYFEVRRNTPSGEIVLQGTVGAGEIDKFAGNRFYLLVRRPAGLRVTLAGRAIALPGAHNLRVLVTSWRTTRLRG